MSDAPVVEVVVEESVTRTKLELFQEGLVLHQIEGVEDVELFFVGLDQQIAHALCQTARRRHVVIRVGNPESVVGCVLQDLTGKAVEGEEVSDFAISSIDAERVNHFLLWHQKMANLVLVEVNIHLGRTPEVRVEQGSDLRNVCINHRSHVGDGDRVKFLEFDVACHCLIGRP